MPINRKLEVNLEFTADTKQAKAQLDSLQNQLTNLINKAPTMGFSGFTKELQQASSAAATLKVQLQNATNVETGKLDLGKFNESLKASGMTLEMYKNQLAALGSQGVAAFSQLSQAIMNAEMPLHRTSTLLTNFATTLKNTMRWQISSSILHGFMGSIQTAYNYAEDLNKSLNNIRIVTGYDTDKMAEFAKEANNAAQALSTTTTAYTDASLIYYQQGLPDEQVKERTDVTIKMANVAGQTAEETSQQLTAVWNNFAKGGENLEYYADVMTALGAATASSSAEISEGLEKFAAVADTVGLSYEYATSALATVTATTRQSADTVGNAFKTLFARIQGLKLGETLEDGTDLNKYSAALAAVGVNIKETNGEMKDMDTILDELGNKWKTLGKDQQMALAQTVAGVRQYTQLIALMDNWDFFQDNLVIAKNAEGTLQEQADIYAEGWRAAQKRVSAAAQQIYSDLLDDKFFIQLNNSLAETLNLLDKIIKGLGGIKGILAILSAGLLKLFGTQLAGSINNIRYELQMMTQTGRDSIQKTKIEVNQLMQDFARMSSNPYDKAVAEAYASIGSVQDTYIKKAKTMDEIQRQITSVLLDQHKVMVDNVVQQTLATKEAEKQAKLAFSKANLGSITKIRNPSDRSDARGILQQTAKIAQHEGAFSNIQNNLFGGIASEDLGNGTKEGSKQVDLLKTNIEKLIKIYGDLNGTIDQNKKLLSQQVTGTAAKHYAELYDILKNITKETPLTSEQLEKVKYHFSELEKIESKVAEGSSELQAKMKILAEQYNVSEEVVFNVISAYRNLGAEEAQTAVDTDALNEKTKNFGQTLNDLARTAASVGQAFAQYAQATSSAAMAATGILNGWTTLTDKSASLTQQITALGFVFSSFGTTIKNLVTGIGDLLKHEATITSYTNIYMAALTALIVVIAAVTNHLQKQKQAIIDQKKEIIESAKAAREAVSANEDLYNSYIELYDAYKEGIGSKEDLYNITNQITDAYNLESEVVARLTGDYDTLTEAIKEKRKESLKDAREKNNEAIKAGQDLGFTSSTGGFKNSLYTGASYKDNIYSVQGIGLTKEEMDALADKYENVSVEGFNFKAAGNVFETYDFLSDYLNKLKEKQNSGEFRNTGIETSISVLEDDLEKLKEGYDAAKAAMESNLDVILEQAATENDIGEATSDNIQGIYDNITNAVKEAKKNGEILPDTDVKTAVDNYIYSLNNEVANELLKIHAAEEAGLTGPALEAFKKKNSSEQDILLKSKILFDENTTTDDLNAILAAAASHADPIYIPIDTYLSINESVLKGKNISKEDWEGLIANIPQDLQDMLGSKEDFNNAGLAERLSLMRGVNEAIAEQAHLETQQVEAKRDASKKIIEDIQNEIDAKIEEYNIIKKQGDASNNYNIEKLKELEEYIEKLNKKKIEVEIEPHYDLDLFDKEISSAAELLLGDIDAIKSGVELIGDNWTVAAEDVRQFAELFPNIMDQLKDEQRLSDGRIKLTKEQTEVVLNSNRQIINSNKQVIVSALDDQIAQLKAELKFQKKKEEIIRETLASDAEAADYEGRLQEALATYKEDLITAGVQVDSQAWDEAMKNAATGSNNIIESISAINEAVSIVHDNIAHIFDKKYPIKDITGTASAENTGSESWTADVKIDDSWLEHQKDLQALQKELLASQERQKELSSDIAEKEGLRAQILKGVKDASDAIDRVNAGQAGKESKDKKSGSKKDKDKELKKLDEEFDRYWQIKKAIDAIDRALSRLDKDQENLFGYELIKSLKEENKLLEQQKANYEALAAAQRQEAIELQNQLMGFGVSFDASGAIINYAEATSRILAEYNDALARYNAGLIDATTLTAFEKNYELFKKLLDRYDKLYYEEMQDTQDKLDDIWRQELANNLKAWEVEIQVKLDMKELKRGWNDFFNEVEDDFQKVYQDLRMDVKNMLDDAKTYIGSDGTITTIINAIHDVTGEIDKLRAGGESSMFESISQAQEKLKELNQQLLDSGRALHDLWKEAWDSYLTGIDQVADQFDDLINRFEKINDELEFQKEIIELLYGPEAYGMMGDFYKGQEKNTLEQMKSLKEQADMWEQLWRQSGATMENQSSWTQDQQKYYEQWQEAQSDLNDIVLEYIKLLKDEYLNTVNDVLKQLEKAITGSSLSDVETEWERISAHAKKYYDNVESAYEVQKFANKISQDIAKTTNLKQQQKLQAFREKEIKYLREKDKLTKYDLEAAEARYQIMLKEMALEDARNNKTSMKLTRNEQGNWSYQYIADEEDVGNKQQDLLDAYGNLYQLSSDAYEGNLGELQDLYRKYSEFYLQLNEQHAQRILNDEEFNRKRLELEKWFFDEYKALAEENTLYRNDLELGASALLLEIYNQDQEAYTAMTEAEQELLNNLLQAHIEGFMDLEEKLKENYMNIGEQAATVMAETREDWLSSAQQIADSWNADDGVSVKAQVLAAYQAIMEASVRYTDLVNQCAVVVCRDFGPEGIAGAIALAGAQTDALKGKTTEMVNTSVSYLTTLKSYVDQIAEAWKSVQDQIRAAIGLIEEYLKYIGDYNRAMESMLGGGGGSYEGMNPAGGGNGDRGNGGGPGDSGGQYYLTTSGGAFMGGPYGSREEAQRAANKLIGSRTGTGLEPTLQVVQYDTGGYTGEWNNGSSNGRLAALHQKELVLNEDDTKNFLSGINTLRDMSALNGSINDSIARAIANMVFELGHRKAGVISNATNNSSSNTENHFNITAEFPNANNVDDIREAILSLPNLASQYIAQNKR